ncbi:hypothetical protein P9265_05190 [Schinkia azotoformans]|uniref:hypothetical protein n=1 Tax=Schinkia azotoformans TaxID=1454 RepID=UPI002E209858|nr:hypothetical protein [Schinkia azotoformans]
MATTHGLSHTRIHKIWRGMKDRCSNPNHDRYHCYGGRGIVVCTEWKNDFLSFYNWSMKNGYSDKLSIERKDVNGPYSPENCTWVSRSVQMRNKQDTHYATINGVNKPLIEWAETYKIPYKTIMTRWYRGWRGKELLQPSKKHRTIS